MAELLNVRTGNSQTTKDKKDALTRARVLYHSQQQQALVSGLGRRRETIKLITKQNQLIKYRMPSKYVCKQF